MSYSRPWMFCGLVLMAVGVVMLWQQGRQPTARAEPPKTAAPDSRPMKSLSDGKAIQDRQSRATDDE